MRVPARAATFTLLLSACGREHAGPLPASSATSPPSAAAVASSDLSEPPAPAPAAERRVGETASQTDYSLAVLEVKECVVPAYFRPKAGHVKLGVRVELTGKTAREVPVNAFHFALRAGDDEGLEYRSTFGGCDPDLQAGRVTTGQRQTGWVTFEIPTNARDLTLRYDPFVLGGAKQELRFNLGR